MKTMWKSLPGRAGSCGMAHRQKDGHLCEGWGSSSMADSSVEHCYEDTDGALWAGDADYESQVNYCPFCGKKADVQAGEPE